MAKSDETLERINLQSCYHKQQKPNWVEGKLTNAFDTETHNGAVFMLSFAFGGDSDYIANENVEKLDGKKIMEKLTDYKARSAINVWYNLDFDANAILSDILTQRELIELNITNGTTTTVEGMEYEIRYVKSKFLRIKDQNDNIYPHYDISQFFYMPLDVAAEEWLGDNKKEDIDTSKFGNKQYIKDHFDEIGEYAAKDAKLTQQLAIELIDEAENLDIPMGKPISTGYLSAEYLRANTESKPDFHSANMQSMFWDSYYGGRFEVFKRGNVGEIAAPDINSAYPAIMKDLPNPSTLEWTGHNNKEETFFSFDSNPFNYRDLKEADYGVVKARVTTDPNEKIQPFAYKINGKVNYPVLTDTVITTIKPIFEFAVDNGLVVDYDLMQGWLGYETDETEYPFDFIGDVYAQRKVFEQLHNKPKKGKLLKIVLNSLYGKTCQTTEIKKILDLSENEDTVLEDYEKVYPVDFVSQNERDGLKDDEVIISAQLAGKRFNPFIASYITGMTRLELHKQVVEHDLVDETVMFATDCLMVEREAYEESNFNELIEVPDSTLPESEFREKAKESLGMWDFDYKGKAFVVGSGVYEVEKPNGDTKLKTRGFIESNIDGTLKEMAQEHDTGIPLENERPLTIAEVLIKPERGNVSEFVRNSKQLKPDFDTKRYWDRTKPTFSDLLECAEESKPIDLAKEQTERLQKAQQMSKEQKEVSESEKPVSELKTGEA